MITRKIGKLFRGKATPFQIVMACLLGSLIGFIPGFMQGPGLTIFLLLLLVILNANLVAAALVGLVAKLASLALLPVSFAVGRVLLDGPAQPLFKALINAPVFALFGFEHYATTGGLVTGALFGLAAGFALVAAVRAFRRKMASLEEGSEKYKRISGAWWAKLLTFVFLGKGHGKKTYAQLMQKKVGNPIRPIGVIFAVLFLGLIFVLQAFLSEPIVTAYMQRGLERANGATVDLDSADLSLREGRLTVTGLAMADPNALDTDLFRAVSLEAAISGRDLLRKRLAIDTVTTVDASSGEDRRHPGRRIGPRPRPAPDPEERLPEEKTIEDYLADARNLQERLSQVRRILERISGPETEEHPDAPPRETLRERLRRQAEERGYARVRADHLIEGAPTLLVRELIAQGVRTAQLEGETMDIRAENISTHPHLVDAAPRVQITTRSDILKLDAGLAGASRAGGQSRFELIRRRLSGDEIGAMLAVAGEPLIRGGTVDLSATTTLNGINIDMPLIAVIRNATITIPGVGSSEVTELTLPIGIRGPIDNPRITFDDKALADALVRAGAARLAEGVRGRADEAIDRATDRARDAVGDRARDA
ncbi:MAG: DUF2062 domain-containing protein, partial [Phycisphaeraceae bacterium]